MYRYPVCNTICCLQYFCLSSTLKYLCPVGNTISCLQYFLSVQHSSYVSESCLQYHQLSPLFCVCLAPWSTWVLSAIPSVVSSIFCLSNTLLNTCVLSAIPSVVSSVFCLSRTLLRIWVLSALPSVVSSIFCLFSTHLSTCTLVHCLFSTPPEFCLLNQQLSPVFSVCPALLLRTCVLSAIPSVMSSIFCLSSTLLNTCVLSAIPSVVSSIFCLSRTLLRTRSPLDFCHSAYFTPDIMEGGLQIQYVTLCVTNHSDYEIRRLKIK
jgi:hypothetical protein